MKLAINPDLKQLFEQGLSDNATAPDDRPADNHSSPHAGVLFVITCAIWVSFVTVLLFGDEMFAAIRLAKHYLGGLWFLMLASASLMSAVLLLSILKVYELNDDDFGWYAYSLETLGLMGTFIGLSTVLRDNNISFAGADIAIYTTLFAYGMTLLIGWAYFWLKQLRAEN